MTTESYILYIEDERPVFDLIRVALKLSGYIVVGAASGQEGLALMRQKKPALLLLDLMMPDMNGWDVYKQVKADAQLIDIPVIVVTAKVPQNNRIIVEGLPPVDDYITKPFDVKRLIRAVQDLI